MKAIPTIPFNDLAAQRSRIATQVDNAMRTVLDHGTFILGPEVDELEEKLGQFIGGGHCITCANGTDALILCLMAQGIGPGDAVFIPAFTFVASAEAVRLVGATPYFCDVSKDTFNIASDSLEDAIAECVNTNLRPRAILSVDLFGQPANYSQLNAIAARHGLIIIADAAQSFGASLDNTRVGSFGSVTTTSFFPAKPLGCYGDGGAIFTQSVELADLFRSLRFHGKGKHKYDNIRVGLNSRLDTLQAAVLLQKLAIFEDEIAARQRIAARYSEGLAGLNTPSLLSGATSVWAQYTLTMAQRDKVVAELAAVGVPTAIYYPIILSHQEAYRGAPLVAAGLPNSAWLANHVISLPMHAYLKEDVQDYIIAAVRKAASRYI